MAIDPSLTLLAGRAPDLGSTFRDILANIGTIDTLRENRETAPLRKQALLDVQAQRQAQTQGIKQQNITDRDTQRISNLSILGQQIKPFLDAGDRDGALQVARQNKARLQSQINQGSNVDTVETDQLIGILEQGNLPLASQLADQAISLGQRFGQQGLTASQRERQGLLATLDDPNASPVAKQSARVALGTQARPTSAAPQIVDVGGVPHIFNKRLNKLVPAEIEGEKVTAKTIAESKSLIRERVKFAELTASSRAKAIDKGFNSIAGINKNIINIDRALSALERGAGTGAAERFFPSIKAASVELDQIQGELALDVVGAVTFGALSKGELDLARDIALPIGLDEPELIDFLQRKKVAQEKLRNYYSEQIQFLDQGGTVAGFLRSKERGLQQTTTSQAPANTVIRFDAQGNIIQ